MYFIQSHNNPFITLPAIVQITGSDRVCCPNAPPAQHLGMGATTVAGWVPCPRAASSALQNMTPTHGGGTSHATLITAGKSCSGCCRVAEQREMWIWWPWHWARNQGMLIVSGYCWSDLPVSLFCFLCLIFQNTQNYDGSCTWKWALKWCKSMPVILSAIGTAVL